MDRLWTPWRYSYLSKANATDTACVFCTLQQPRDDAADFVLWRGQSCFVLLNLYPYTSGHLMVVTQRHIAQLSEADASELSELMLLAQRAQRALGKTYHPDGYNVGMNLGACAGAGIAGHLHLHVVPRWAGDANFMSVTSETRILPETLRDTYEKLLHCF